MYNYHNQHNKKSKWIKYIEDNLTKNGLHFMFLNPREYIHSEFTKRLDDQYLQEWQNQLNMSNKTVFYKEVTGTYGFNETIDTLQIRISKYLTKFKTNNHKLPVITGSWNNIPFKERFCPNCENQLGDELHYLFICPLFANERKRYIKPYYSKNPNMYKTY